MIGPHVLFRCFPTPMSRCLHHNLRQDEHRGSGISFVVTDEPGRYEEEEAFIMKNVLLFSSVSLRS